MVPYSYFVFSGNNSGSSSIPGRGKDSAYVTEHQYRPAALQLEDCEQAVQPWASAACAVVMTVVLI